MTVPSFVYYSYTSSLRPTSNTFLVSFWISSPSFGTPRSGIRLRARQNAMMSRMQARPSANVARAAELDEWSAVGSLSSTVGAWKDSITHCLYSFRVAVNSTSAMKPLRLHQYSWHPPSTKAAICESCKGTIKTKDFPGSFHCHSRHSGRCLSKKHGNFQVTITGNNCYYCQLAFPMYLIQGEK